MSGATPSGRPGDAPLRTGAAIKGGPLGSPSDQAFDRLTRLAAHVVGAPIAVISLAGGGNQFLKAQVGLPEPWASVRQVPLAAFFCLHVVTSGAPLVVEDARTHPLLNAHPAMRDLGVGAYLGVPLRLPDGTALGTLCAMDRRPRAWEARDVAALEDLAGAVVGEIALRDELARRERTEAALREANRLLTISEELAHVGHWRVEMPAGRLRWSDEVFRINGRDPEAGPPALHEAIAAYHPEDRPRILRALNAALNGADRMEYEARLIRPGGEVRFVISRAMCEREGGTLKAISGMKLDVTDLKRAEEAAKEAGALFRGLFEHATDRLFVHRVEPGGSTWLEAANPVALAALGLSPETVRGSQIEDILPPDAAAKVRPDLERVLATGQVVRAEEVHSEGRGETVEIIYVPLRDASDGPITRIFVSVRDITHLRTAEAALRESEARYRLLADNTSDLIVLGHADGRRSYISPAVTPMTGYTVEEAHRVSMRDWIHPDDIARVFAVTAGLSSDRPTASVVYRLRRKDGTYLWAEAAFQRVGEEGQVTITTAIRDVSERQAQAEQLRLAKEAAERAKAEADRASKAKTEFLATMSHEIRTPLNSIIGFTDVLLDSPLLPPALRRHTELIGSSGGALLTIVNDVLDFSKVEAGAIELVRLPFAPEALVENSLAIVQGLADAKGLQLRAEVEPGLPASLVGDEARLRQVLLNLLNNAIKFTASGAVTLEVRREASAPEEETLCFRVADTGMGIAGDQQDRLFERFSQVDGSIRRDFGGTGLGLAICKRLVELMGGAIGVVSQAGQGATFWFRVTLPRGTPELARSPMPSAEPGLPRQARLLLVEDVDINQELARLVLEAAGHRVDVASDGAEAISAVQSRPYDLVLMDVQMPGMDGLAATRHIRALDHPARSVPIIAMTANVLPDQVRQFREAGMDAHVGKPFHRAELHAAIARVLDAAGRTGG